MSDPVPSTAETPEARLKRLSMRSHRRGTREMDLILGPFAQAQMPLLTPAELDLYEVLLEENDQDLYLWVASRQPGAESGPEPLRPLLDRIAAFAQARMMAARGGA